VPQRYAKEDDTEKNTDSEAAEEMQTHFQKVSVRSDVPVDRSVLDEIYLLDIYDDVTEALSSPPSDDKTRNTIKEMKYGKVAGVTGATPYMLKVLPNEAVIYIKMKSSRNFEITNPAVMNGTP
jgi:hypothetical protein